MNTSIEDKILETESQLADLEISELKRSAQKNHPVCEFWAKVAECCSPEHRADALSNLCDECLLHQK